MALLAVTAAEIKCERWSQGVAYYDIAVCARGGSGSWSTSKRYSDFLAFDRQLSGETGIRRLDLPPRGLCGLRHRLGIGYFNRRRLARLEAYLQYVLLQAARGPGPWGVVEDFLAKPPECEAPGAAAPRLSAARASAAPYAVGRPAALPALRPRPDGAADGADLAGPAWNRFQAAEPTLAGLVRRCAEATAQPARFQNDCEDIFQPLRRTILRLHRAPPAGDASGLTLAEVPGKAEVWHFVLLVAAQRPFLQLQAAEVGRVLEACEPWAAELYSSPDLHGRRLQMWED